MKRILALLCVIACLCCLAVPALAANDTVTVHAYVPGDWDDVRLWAWDDNDQNPSNAGTWPGNLVMTKGDDGWYSIEIPANFPNMLVNAYEGTLKTADIDGIDVSKDVWIVVNQDSSTQVYNSKPDVSAPPVQNPVTVDVLSIVGEGVPGLQNWIVEDTAGDMTKGAGDVYTKEIAVTAGTSMKFKFAANHSWDYNFGGAEEGITVAVGTSVELPVNGKDLTLTAEKDCTLKFTVTLANGAATLLVEEASGTTGGEEVKPTEPVETKPVETKPAETQPTETTPAGNNEVKPTDNTALFAVIGSVVVVAIAAVVYIILKKKQ